MWLYKQNNEELGPVSWAELQALAAAKELQPTDVVCAEGSSRWRPVASLPGLLQAPSPGGGGAPETSLALSRIGPAPETSLALSRVAPETGLTLPQIDDEGQPPPGARPAGWYWAQSRPQRVGPFSGNQLLELAASATLKPTDMVWLEGTLRWVPAGSVAGLFPTPPPSGAPGAAAAPMEIAVAVRCRNVTKAFGEGNARTLALRGADLDVYTGTLTMLVGPSGCGKTTLVSAVAGTLDISEGSIQVFGQDLVAMNAGRKVRFRGTTIGFVFQQFNLLPALTAAENAAMPLLIAGRPRRKAVARASELLVKIGMGKRLNHYPRQMSGGQQQRVAIARALVHEPRLLVADEPTSALDAETGLTVMELLRNVAVHPERAVIVVTHDSRIFEFSDRTVHMEDGRVVAVEDRPGLQMPLSVFTSDRLQPVRS